MGIMNTIRARHSVRDYTEQPLEGEVLAKLQLVVDECAERSGLNIQLVLDNPEVFQVVARFGLVRGARSSIAFVTANGKGDDEVIGYWGQHIVLAAQEFGLNTCWVAMCSRRKSKAQLAAGEKLRLVAAVGYGATQGEKRPTKPAGELALCECDSPAPWFAEAVEAAQLAPTAMNNQNFRLTLLADGKTVRAEAPDGGWNKVDLGIVKANFALVANELDADWRWA